MYRQNGDDIVHSQANALLGSRSTLPLDLGRSVADEWSAQTAIARGDQQKAALGSPQPEANDGLTQRVERGAWSVELGCAVMLIPFQTVEEQGQPGWRSRRRVTVIDSLMTKYSRNINATN